MFKVSGDENIVYIPVSTPERRSCDHFPSLGSGDVVLTLPFEHSDVSCELGKRAKVAKM